MEFPTHLITQRGTAYILVHDDDEQTYGRVSSIAVEPDGLYDVARKTGGIILRVELLVDYSKTGDGE
jgi:hypothetical protein